MQDVKRSCSTQLTHFLPLLFPAQKNYISFRLLLFISLSLNLSNNSIQNYRFINFCESEKLKKRKIKFEWMTKTKNVSRNLNLFSLIWCCLHECSKLDFKYFACYDNFYVLCNNMSSWCCRGFLFSKKRFLTIYNQTHNAITFFVTLTFRRNYFDGVLRYYNTTLIKILFLKINISLSINWANKFKGQ